MKFWSRSFGNGEWIPERFAVGAHDPESHVRFVDNRSPHVAWEDLPAGTRSLVILCHDPDVPSVGDDVNKPGRRVPETLPRVDFFHWVLVDVDPAAGELPEGAFGGFVARGKPGPFFAGGPGSEDPGPRGAGGPGSEDRGGPSTIRQGINDYTSWFAGDPAMAGDYYGYDGPCPPWNDPRRHHYIFTAYALDVPRAPVEGRFDGHAVRRAIAGHILDWESFTGLYRILPVAPP